MPASPGSQTFRGLKQKRTPPQNQSPGATGINVGFDEPHDDYTPANMGLSGCEMGSYHDTLTISSPFSPSHYCDTNATLTPQSPEPVMQHAPVWYGYGTQYINPNDMLVWQPHSPAEAIRYDFTAAISQVNYPSPMAQGDVEPNSTFATNMVDFYPSSDYTQYSVLPETQWVETGNVEMELGEEVETIQIEGRLLPARRPRPRQRIGPYGVLTIPDDGTGFMGSSSEAERIRLITAELTEMGNRYRSHARDQLRTIGDGL